MCSFRDAELVDSSKRPSRYNRLQRQTLESNTINTDQVGIAILVYSSAIDAMDANQHDTHTTDMQYRDSAAST